ncbi:hypothetical protein WKW80_14045 [Variovorax humicola]|uniref:Uncharacterized protein n=1 Tax=Variovorax humicola TaxID=1769758 RepID=A0ABU8W0X4_9BURK
MSRVKDFSKLWIALSLSAVAISARAAKFLCFKTYHRMKEIQVEMAINDGFEEGTVLYRGEKASIPIKLVKSTMILHGGTRIPAVIRSQWIELIGGKKMGDIF